MLFFAAALLYITYREYKHDGLDISEIGFTLLFIALLSGFGIALLASAYSKPFRRKFFPEWENDAPVIECKQCLYDLRGSVLAGSNKCPECGSVVSNEQLEQIQRLDQGLKNKKQAKHLD